MKVRSLIVGLMACVAFSCNPLKKLPGLESQADIAIEQSNYEQAYVHLKQYQDISESGNIKPKESFYLKMATVCGHLNKVEEASGYYENLINKEGNERVILDYTSLLAKNNELDKELDVWSRYQSKLKDKNLQAQAFNRQVVLLSQSQKYEQVESLWSALAEEVNVTPEAWYSYVMATQQLGNSRKALKACNALLKLEPNHIKALEWKAKFLYESAEKRYKTAMAKYNKNKNATTYAYLRRDLKKISADFRVSKDLFLKVRKMNPENKSYVKYLKNIYLRLDMKNEAAKMDKFLK